VLAATTLGTSPWGDGMLQVDSDGGRFRRLIAGVLVALGAIGAVADQLALEGGWVTGVFVGLVLFGAIVGIWDQVAAPARDRRAEVRARGQDLRSVMEVEAAPVGHIDPYSVGVFSSELAAEKSGGTSPYVPRTVDESGVIDAAFDEAALGRTERMVVVRGVPKSGKSRTLWEALVRHCPDRLLVALRPPLISEQNSPEAMPLKSFLDAKARNPREGLVLWIDDAHDHFEHGLTRSALLRTVARYPDIIIAMTLHTHQLERMRKFDEPLERLLRKASETLELEPRLTDDELARARASYPLLASEDELEWLPELFAAVDILRRKYRDNAGSQPVGVALTKAAIDWRRAGMPSTIQRDDLRALAEIVREDTAGIRTIADDEFAEALTWATAEVRARASLLRASGELGGESYEVFDALIRSDTMGHRPVSDECWQFVLDRIGATSGVSVGLTAFQAGKWYVAEAAWRKVSRSKQAEAASIGLFYLGVLYGLLERNDEAIAVYDKVVARFADDPAPAVREQAAKALFNKGVTLRQLDRGDEANPVYDEVVARFADDPDPAVREAVATALGLFRESLRPDGTNTS
jgi:cellulose synthase operon protein C